MSGDNAGILNEERRQIAARLQSIQTLLRDIEQCIKKSPDLLKAVEGSELVNKSNLDNAVTAALGEVGKLAQNNDILTREILNRNF